MARKLGLTLILTLVTVTSASAQQWAKKMFETTEHDFGTVARGAKAEFDFQLSNIYVEDVHIVSAYSSCGCTSVSIVKPTLKTYDQGAIHAVFNTPSFLGSRSATLTVILDKPFPAEVQLHVRGVIRSDVVFEPGSVQLGDVDQGSGAAQRVRMVYSGWGDWKVGEIKSSNPHISAKVLQAVRQNGQTVCDLAVHLDRAAPVGYLKDHISLAIEGQQTEMPLAVEGRVVSGISVSPSSLFMGIVKPGEEASKTLVVRAKKPFRILSITCADKSFKFAVDKAGDAKLVHVIPVTFLAGADAGKVTEQIRIVTDLGATTPQLSAYAVVAPQVGKE